MINFYYLVCPIKSIKSTLFAFLYNFEEKNGWGITTFDREFSLSVLICGLTDMILSHKWQWQRSTHAPVTVNYNLCMGCLIMTAMKKRGKFVNDCQSTSIFLLLFCKILQLSDKKKCVKQLFRFEQRLALLSNR